MKHVLLAEYATAREAKDAARSAAAAGQGPIDALCPNPIDGIDEYLSPSGKHPPIGWVMFAGGVAGWTIGYFMQWYSLVKDYPVMSGGRPLDSWPTFVLVAYETTILAAAISGVVAWLSMCGLPRLYHFLFESEAVARAAQDRYVLVFAYSEAGAIWISGNLKPLTLSEVRA